jgi:hypothetical protein
MPLQAGTSPSVISENVRDMIRAGHPPRVAVAAALHNAHPERRALGGGMAPHIPGLGQHMGGMGIKPAISPHVSMHMPSMLPRRDDGGAVAPTPGLQPNAANSAPIARSYIQRFAQMSPEQLQEMVARLGNSPLAGIAQQVLKQKQTTPQAPSSYAQTAQPTPLSDQGQQQAPAPQPAPQQTQQSGMQPAQQAARGGSAKQETVPILAAGGEFIIAPEHVARWGNGDVEKGHRELDRFVVETRQKIIKEMAKLKGPVRS